MSAWRGTALQLFPEFKESLLASDDYLKVWRDLHRLFRKAIAEGDQKFATRFFHYAVWHLARRSHQTRQMPEAAQAAAELLYEFVDELEKWIDRYDFIRAQHGLKYFLGESRYAEFESRFLARTPGYVRKRSA